MALRKIVRFPDPFLRKPTEKVTKFDEDLKRLVQDMTETMYAHNGAGLAAIQVGSSAKIFIVEPTVAGLSKEDAPVVFINPVLEWVSSEQEVTEEGCLSFPGIFVPVKRSLQARMRAQDAEGNEFVAEGKALYARAMQHEQDHLQNKLLYDHAGSMKRQSIKRQMERMTEEKALALTMEYGD